MYICIIIRMISFFLLPFSFLINSFYFNPQVFFTCYSFASHPTGKWEEWANNCVVLSYSLGILIFLIFDDGRVTEDYQAKYLLLELEKGTQIYRTKAGRKNRGAKNLVSSPQGE